MVTTSTLSQLDGVPVSGSATYFGLSTDSKPTDGVSNGSCFLEMNTGKIYFYDADGAQWLEWGA